MNLPSVIAYSILINSAIWILMSITNWWPSSIRLDHGFMIILLASIIGGWYLSTQYRLTLQNSILIIVGYAFLNIFTYFL